VYLREYRIPLPLSVDEFRHAQRYLVSRFSRERTVGGEGVEIVEDFPYRLSSRPGQGPWRGQSEVWSSEAPDDVEAVVLEPHGQYTHKIIHLEGKLPSACRSLVPSNSLVIEERAWNEYPHVCNTYYCPLLGDRLAIRSETRYLPDLGVHNALGLSDVDLQTREVDVVDIVNDPIDPSLVAECVDLTEFVSETTGRPPLKKDWLTNLPDPHMCIYKAVWVEFRYWGLQTIVERWIHERMLRNVSLLGHRQVCAWIDDWIGLTWESILRYERETAEYLNQHFKMLSGAQQQQPQQQQQQAQPAQASGGWSFW